MEVSGNTPPPIKTWWYPGNSTGYEFIYPRQQALELAKVVNEPVLTTGKDTKDLETADLTRVTSSDSEDHGTVNETPDPPQNDGARGPPSLRLAVRRLQPALPAASGSWRSGTGYSPSG